MNKNLTMYQTIQFESDVNNSTKKQLLLMMYDSIIANLNEIAHSIQHGDILARTQKIKKVLSIIEIGLIMSLSKDKAKEVADSLELFYEESAKGIVLANATNNIKILDSIKQSFIDLKKCWTQVKD